MTSTSTSPTRSPKAIRPSDLLSSRRPAPALEPSAGSEADDRARKRVRRRRFAIAGVFGIAGVALLAGISGLSGGVAETDQSLVYFDVQPRDLSVSVTERGTLESQSKVQINCEVDDIHGDGIQGTPVLWIVENGTSVEKGDLLVELDASSHQERLDEQVLQTEDARAEYTQAELFCENQESRNKTAKKNAELEVELAKLDLQQYAEIYQIQLREIELEIVQKEEQRKISDRHYDGMTSLYDKGYRSKGDLAQARLEKIRADVAWEGEKAKQAKLTDYNSERSRLQLEVAVELAEDALIQVVEDNEANLAQAKARLQAAKRSLEKEEERLARYREQLEKCKIFAPQKGMVAYHVERSRWRQSSNIAEGVAVNPRQPILSLPDLTRMQVELSVHESVVDRVQAGMKATVRLDAFRNRSYEATVDEVAVLPDPGGWLSSDTKVYKTLVKLDEELDGAESRSLKPGMTAVVEIRIASLEDVLCIPVQAVVQRGNQTWCYVARDNQPEKRVIELGQTNDKFVEISAGLERGERVVLNPSAILESEPTEQREIGPSRKQPETGKL